MLNCPLEYQINKALLGTKFFCASVQLNPGWVMAGQPHPHQHPPTCQQCIDADCPDTCEKSSSSYRCDRFRWQQPHSGVPPTLLHPPTILGVPKGLGLNPSPLPGWRGLAVATWAGTTCTQMTLTPLWSVWLVPAPAPA